MRRRLRKAWRSEVWPRICDAVMAETSEAQTEVPPVQTDIAVAMAERAKTTIERDELGQGHVLDSHAETSQVHTVSEK